MNLAGAERDAALLDALARCLSDARASNRPLRVHAMQPINGGCIHHSFRLEADCGVYFLKLNEAEKADTLAAEADGLRALSAAGVRVPAVIAQGETSQYAFLLLEYLSLIAPTAASEHQLGEALARLHAHTNTAHGWPRDNYIGLSVQRNAWHTDWVEFWSERRLRPQLELAATNGHTGMLQRLGTKVLAALPQLLAEHRPAPALLHGDLWRGNAGVLAGGTPVLYDPAVYYGDAETDLAMAELFGGFTPAFHAGYRSIRPVDAGYALRRPLYQLYHVLNHLNLFGGGYRRQAEALMQRLLA